MRPNTSLFSFCASAATAFALVAAIFVFPDLTWAREPEAKPSAANVPGAQPPRHRAALTTSDELAAMESVHIALSQVADGSTYVWHRSHGLLSGVVRPTSSFKDSSGQVCRHFVVILNSLDTTRRTEAIACRGGDGVWQLDG